jgi:hypothetical protein
MAVVCGLSVARDNDEMLPAELDKFFKPDYRCSVLYGCLSHAKLLVKYENTDALKRAKTQLSIEPIQTRIRK